jgi:hypothetical protein
MRVQIQNGGSYLRLALGAAILCLLCTPNWAAEFGEVHVVSHIGQPLVVEVELTALSNEEATGLQVRPSGPDVFRGANIQMNPVLSSMHWVIRHRDKHQFLRITTDKPVHASFLNMFFELGTKNERSVRALTVWLEPRPGAAQDDGVAASALPTLPQPVASSAPSEEGNPQADVIFAIPAGRGRDCSASQQRCVAVDRENRAIRSQIRSLEKELIVLNQTILGSSKVALPAARKPASAPALADTKASQADQDSASATASVPDDSELFLKKEEETILPAKKPLPKVWPWKLIAIGAGAGLLLLALAAWLYRKRRAKAKKTAKPGESAQAPAMEGVVAEEELGGDAERAAALAAAHPPKWWKKWRYALTERWKSLVKSKSGEGAGSAPPEPKPGLKARLIALWGKLTKKSAPGPILEPD